MTPHLTIEMEQCVQNAGQPPRRRLVVFRKRGHEPVPASLHQPAHDLSQLRPRRINAIELGQRLLRPSGEDVVEQRVEQARIRDTKQRPRAVQRDWSRRQRHQLIEQSHRVPHRALRSARDQLHRISVD